MRLILNLLWLVLSGFWMFLGYLLIGGYTLGSVGIEILTADDEPPAAAPDHTPPPALPTPADKAPAPTAPFRFATWDDEEKPS